MYLTSALLDRSEINKIHTTYKMSTLPNSQEGKERKRPVSRVVNLDSTKYRGLPDIFEVLGKRYFLPVPHVSYQASDLEQKYFNLVEGLYVPRGVNDTLHQALANFLPGYSAAIEALHYGNSNNQVLSEKAKLKVLSGIIPFLETQVKRLAEQRYTDPAGTEKVSYQELLCWV